MLAAFVLLAALVALVVRAEIGAPELIDDVEKALWWLAVALVGGALALVAWWLERREAKRRAERAAAKAVERERERAHGQLSEVKDEYAREISELTRRRERERRANAELRRKVADLQHQHGSLGDWHDLHDLVLHAAIALTGARKGLLLTQRDGTASLAVSAQDGFERDASDSEIARRFADKVLERDQTMREDDPTGGHGSADREIDNLVAIPIFIRDEFSGVVVCANRDGGFEELEDDVLLAMGDQAGAILQNTRLHGDLRAAYLATVRLLAEAIQAKDPFLRGHSEEVSDYVAGVATRLGMDPAQREELVYGSLLHDVGKIGISERILHKPGRLTAEEFAIIQLHPRIGYRLIEQVPALRRMAPAILHHHERYDGGGYPTGLKGEQIPLEARIVCVADAFSAMTADRPYRARMALAEACAELERHAGTQFDPEVVRLFLEEVRQHPVDEKSDSGVMQALDDAELQLHRTAEEPVLGAGALALTDSLTLLYGHRYFHEAAAAEAERSRVQERSFAVALVCVDEVAQINADSGYAAGDTHLRNAARVLSRVAVRLGATACRDGGVVLGVLVPGTREASPDALVDELRRAMSDFGAVRVAAAAWRPGEDGEAVIARARDALAVVEPAGEAS